MLLAFIKSFKIESNCTYIMWYIYPAALEEVLPKTWHPNKAHSLPQDPSAKCKYTEAQVS